LLHKKIRHRPRAAVPDEEKKERKRKGWMQVALRDDRDDQGLDYEHPDDEACPAPWHFSQLAPE